MTDHPLTETRVEKLWNAHVPSVLNFQRWNWGDRIGILAALRAAFDAGREYEREHADPYHDPRPWQDCTRKDIRAGDLVEARDGDRLHVGVAHHQDEDGDWCTEDGWFIIWNGRQSLRRIPAPTPPAEEVDLPTEFGAVITDVEMRSGEQYDRMVYTECFWAYDAASYESKYVTAFTLPDGTRVLRDGDRFIKVQKEDA